MRLNWSTLATLYRTELRMVLRDRRLLLTSVVLPILVMPLMFLGSNWSLKKREAKLQSLACRYAVQGPEAEWVRDLMSRTRERLAAEPKGTNTAPFEFEEVACTNALAALEQGDIHVILEGGKTPAGAAGPAGEPAGPAAASRKPELRPRSNSAPAPLPRSLRLVFMGNHDESVTCAHRLQEALEATRRAERVALLLERGLPAPPDKIAAFSLVDVATPGQVAGVNLGRVLTLLLVLFMLTGGAVVALDSLAGEKERGTLETLLTTGATRLEIVVAKHLLIITVALGITLAQVANLLVYVGLKLVPVPGSLAAAVTPATGALLLVLLLPVAALASGILLLASGRARTYKEAQFYFFPLFLLGLVPAVAPLLPGLPLRSAVAIVPVANIAMGVREVLIGSFDWPMLALAWVTTAAAAAWTTRGVLGYLSAERLITSSERDEIEFLGGLPLFRRRVWAWFAVLWAVLLVVSSYLEKADLRLQLLVNLVGVFFLGSLLMLRTYRLDPRQALALRQPRPAVWLGVLFAVPGGMLAAIGAFHLLNFVIPVPPQVLEGFQQNVLPQDIPFVQLLFFLSVLPAFFEEIAFRGLLLHGLVGRFRPVTVAVLVGVVFGLFHLALFRFAPTACLGVMLAAVTLLTGSIYPAMLWHFLSNLGGVLAARFDIPLAHLDAGGYLAGAGILCAAFWILWRNRTPYPGLNAWRDTRPRASQACDE